MQGLWRLSLRSAFKNFRRDYPQNENQPPSAKRRKITEDVDDAFTDETSEEEYEEAIKELQAHNMLKEKRKNHSKIKKLMEQTYAKRQKWIHDTNTLIADVIKLFPSLSTSKGVNLSIQLFVSVPMCIYVRIWIY